MEQKQNFTLRIYSYTGVSPQKDNVTTSSPGRFSRPTSKAREKRPGDEVDNVSLDFIKP